MIEYPARVSDANLLHTLRDLVDAANRADTQLEALNASPGAHTMVLAKLSVSGTTGSLTWNDKGMITKYVDPT